MSPSDVDVPGRPHNRTDNKVYIFDTTLRDGEQSPGAALTMAEKLQIAKQLEKLKVDVIEAGFPISSPGDFESVQTIAREIRGSSVCGLARATYKDIDAAWDAVKEGAKPRIHTFIGTSDIHIETKFKKTRDEILTIARDMVAYAVAKSPDVTVEFSAEDAGRTDPFYLYKVIEAVIDAGASVVNLPDTVGYRIPEEFGKLIRGVMNNVPNVEKAIISVHCHNDLGLATANSLAGVFNGARQIECTVNGIGERAGNAAMEEVVMSIRTRPDFFGGIYTDIQTQHFFETSQMVSQLTRMPMQHNKAIVGRNAFAHESGIHQDGYLKGRETYEIMTPESVGFAGTELPLGPRSGRAAVKARLEKLNISLTDEQLSHYFESYKRLADEKKRVEDDDLKNLYNEFMSVKS